MKTQIRTRRPKYKTRQIVKFMPLLVAATLTIGCATTDVKSTLLDGYEKVSTTVKSGVQNIKKGNSTSNTSDQTNANDLALVGRFPITEVPHTLLRKPLATGRLTSGHGYRLSPTGIPLPRKHKGVDYAAETGTEIFAAGGGTIEKLYTSKSYGNYIRIKHDNGFSTAYAHMNSFTDGLKTGSEVHKGQVIGTVGSTGKSSGPHLHFELLYGSQFINPLFKYTKDADVSAQSDEVQ